MRLVPYEPWHARLIELQPAQAYMREFMTEEDIQQRALCEQVYTVMDGTDILCCSGIYHFWPGRGMIWSMISHKVDAKKLVGLHKLVMHQLEFGPNPARLEMIVDSDFRAGHRWAMMLGFEHEAHMKGWGPDGRDTDQYVRFF